LQLAHAHAMQAKAAYQEFLTIWKTPTQACLCLPL
jgi:hypothetical protein